jgi:hypothetical protein
MKLLTGAAIVLTALSCSPNLQTEDPSGKYHDISDSTPKDTLLLVYDGEEGEAGTTVGYINQQGDTIIPTGKYVYAFLDTATTYLLVIEEGTKGYAIDPKGNLLWDIYWYDNGPDYVEEGLFRIERNGKIGYADTTGRVVIPAQYACASPFSEGRAQVTFDCELEADEHGEHHRALSDTWFYIDRTGQKIATTR